MSYELIETVTVGAGGASSIEFTSIPQDGTDLVLKLSARHNLDSTVLRVLLNNDTGANYSRLNLRGDGSAVSISTNTGQTSLFNSFAINRGTFTTNTFANTEMLISNYTSSNPKSVSFDAVIENNASLGFCGIQASLWDNSASLITISLGDFGSNVFVEHTTATLYKITAS